MKQKAAVQTYPHHRVEETECVSDAAVAAADRSTRPVAENIPDRSVMRVVLTGGWRT